MSLDEKVFHALNEAGQDWADKNAAASLLEETKSVAKNQVIQALLRVNPNYPMSKLESLAYAHPDYEEHIEKMVEARKEANRARAFFDAKKAKWEALRSMESTKRAEMGLR